MLHFSQLKEMYPNELDYLKAVKLSLNHCYNEAKKVIPNFHEVLLILIKNLEI